MKTINISNKIKNLIVIVIMLTPLISRCQDPTFSQFFNNPVYYNPAYAGSHPGMRARLNYRNQWHNLPSNYNNYTLTIDAAEPNLPGAGGLGLVLHSDFDGFGNVRTTSASLIASVKIEFSEEFITMFGIGTSFVQRSIDWSGLTFSDQLDPRYGRVSDQSAFPEPDFYKTYYPDFSTGFMFRYCESSEFFKRIVATLSVSAQHVFRPDISFTGLESKLPIRMVVMGDLLLDNETPTRTGGWGSTRGGSSDFKLNPGFLYEKQGEMTNFAIGLNAYKNFIYSGVWVRSQSFTFTRVNDLVLMVGLNVPFADNSGIKIRYSYDYVLSELRRTVGATHEISLIYELANFSFFGNPAMRGGRMLPGGRTSQSCADCPLF